MSDLFNTIFIFGISIIPSLIIFGLILYSDRKSSEPFFLMILCAISGLFTITTAMFIQNYIVNAIKLVNIDEIISFSSGFRIFLMSAVEEYCKLFVLYHSLWW